MPSTKTTLLEPTNIKHPKTARKKEQKPTPRKPYQNNPHNNMHGESDVHNGHDVHNVF
jgi:hypothetical protein